MPRLVGVERALRMCWTDEAVSGAEALEYGLVDRVVAGKLLHGALEFLRARLGAAKTHRATSERDELLAAGEAVAFLARGDTAAALRSRGCRRVGIFGEKDSEITGANGNPCAGDIAE